MPKKKPKSRKKEILNTLRDKKYELLINFFVMLIGIILGFQIEGRIKQISLNNNTRTKLHIMYLESEYNIIKAKHIYDICSDKTILKISFKKLDDLAARAATNDENIFNILQPNKISLTLGYIDAIQTLNSTYETYINYLESIGYENNSKAEALKEIVKDNSIGFIATCCVFQQKLKPTLDEKEYDKKELSEIDLEIQKAKENISRGNFKLEK